MSKPVLGRGLDRLMPPAAPENATHPPEPPAVGPGLRILIRGAERAEDSAPAASPASTQGNVVDRRIGIVLALADAGLVGWPAFWLHRHAGKISLLAWAASIASIALGAAAGVLAARIWLGRHDEGGRKTAQRTPVRGQS